MAVRFDARDAARLERMYAAPEIAEQRARTRAAREGVADRVAFAIGDATRLEFPAASFDFVVGVQVYLYVTEIERALAEAARVLRPGGRLAIVDTDWESCVWLTSDPARHARVMAARLGHFAHPHLPPRLPKLLRAVGLTLTHASVIPLLDLRYDSDSFSVGVIGATKSVAIRHGASPEDAEAWEADLRSRTSDGDYFFSLNRFLFLAEKR